MSTETLDTLELHESQLSAERSALVLQKVQNESDLAQIAAQFRSGYKFPRDQYSEVLGRQARLIADNARLLKRIAEIKPERHRISQIIFDLRQERKAANDVHGDDGELRSEILSLRKRYSEFAADATRVSSMRRMASEFVCDLDSVLKKVASEFSKENR